MYFYGQLDTSNGMICSSNSLAPYQHYLEVLIPMVDSNAWQVMISSEYQERGLKTL